MRHGRSSHADSGTSAPFTTCRLPQTQPNDSKCSYPLEPISLGTSSSRFASGPANTAPDLCLHRLREVLGDERVGVSCAQPVRASEVPIIVEVDLRLPGGKPTD